MPQREPTPLEMIGMLSGDPVIGKAVTAGRPLRGGLKSLGHGFVLDPNTGEVVQDPGYRDYETELHKRGLQKPDPYAVETDEGLTIYETNPRNPNFRGSPDVVDTAPPRAVPAAAQSAAKYERMAADTERMLENLPEGVGDLGKSALTGALEWLAPEALEPVARSAALDILYTKEEQKALRGISQTFATNIREFAGAAQTESEKANILKFLPHEAMTHEQLIEAMEGFIDYASQQASVSRYPYDTPEQARARQTGSPAPTVAPTPNVPTVAPDVSSQGTDQLRQELEELRNSQGGI